VWAENDKALRLYENYGFKVIGETPFRVDGVVVGKDTVMRRGL
jgi:ribosomal protein S18 acetylase RimI-like enzyme